ncbi:CBS and ACT domain-containing protein [uncultured Selenomonas sp.]|uniref:CBS and ACT domain-containing protein n=1 Tax=uncultured Selenomonas sp. TaxID=159275 RepID=UPI0025F7D241|nr:CBS and ACT domain-containing protein [uncultured Selenomonas sp.]
MFVANRMTKNPTVVTPDTGIDTAARLMKKGRFRRLPVVEDGKLVGFLNDKDIMRVSPSPATTLSRYEVTTLLSKLKVADIMQKNVISVSEDATIEEAALLMYKEKIGGLPVVSSVGSVVGVITETDIFKTFVDVMALDQGRTRLTLDVEDKVGVVADIAGIFAASGYSIDSLVTCRQPTGRYEIIVRTDITDDAKIDALTKALGDKGYSVVHTAKIG